MEENTDDERSERNNKLSRGEGLSAACSRIRRLFTYGRSFVVKMSLAATSRVRRHR